MVCSVISQWFIFLNEEKNSKLLCHPLWNVPQRRESQEKKKDLEVASQKEAAENVIIL